MKFKTVTLSVILFFFCLSRNSFSVEKPLEGCFTKVEGRIEVQREKKDWKRALLYTTVSQGDTVKVGEKSEAEITFDEGTAVRLEDETEVVVSTSVWKEAKKAGELSVRLEKGKLLANFIKGPKSKFEVFSGGAKCAVRGTIFVVERRLDLTKIGVYKGTVTVENIRPTKGAPKKEVLLKEKEETAVKLDATPEKPSPLSAPMLKYWEEQVKMFNERVEENRKRLEEIYNKRKELLEQSYEQQKKGMEEQYEKLKKKFE